jgi:uncharacterized protein
MRKKRTLTKRQIITLLKEHEQALKDFGVKRIALFGSYATGKQTQASDIDFLVEFEQPTFDNFMNLSSYLERLFHKKVDVLTNSGIESIRVKEVVENIKKSVVYV